MTDQRAPIEREAIEQAAQYVLDNSRRSNASLNEHQRDADTAALMTAYRDIIGKAIQSGYLSPILSALPASAAEEGALDSYEKFDGVGPHTETIETRARIGERYLEAYESALSDPRLAGYMPADCPSELLIDLLNGNMLSPTPAPDVSEERARDTVDLPEAFESWWAMSSHHNRRMIGYSGKKCLAFAAFEAAASLLAPAIDGREDHAGDVNAMVERCARIADDDTPQSDECGVAAGEARAGVRIATAIRNLALTPEEGR